LTSTSKMEPIGCTLSLSDPNANSILDKITKHHMETFMYE
jgi:hypothetical protein